MRQLGQKISGQDLGKGMLRTRYYLELETLQVRCVKPALFECAEDTLEHFVMKRNVQSLDTVRLCDNQPQRSFGIVARHGSVIIPVRTPGQDGKGGLTGSFKEGLDPLGGTKENVTPQGTLTESDLAPPEVDTSKCDPAVWAPIRRPLGGILGQVEEDDVEYLWQEPRDWDKSVAHTTLSGNGKEFFMNPILTTGDASFDAADRGCWVCDVFIQRGEVHSS